LYVALCDHENFATDFLPKIVEGKVKKLQLSAVNCCTLHNRSEKKARRLQIKSLESEVKRKNCEKNSSEKIRRESERERDYTYPTSSTHDTKKGRRMWENLWEKGGKVA
jgi:hypothetical protein